VNFTLTEANKLRIDYSPETDKSTVINLTNPLILQSLRRRFWRWDELGSEDRCRPVHAGECEHDSDRRVQAGGRNSL
jgi:hypothetical protein